MRLALSQPVLDGLAGNRTKVVRTGSFLPQAVPAFDVWLVLLIASWAAVAVGNIWLSPLWPVDETRYVSVAWEMWWRGDFLVPHVNGQPYSHKPPMLFWLIHGGWAVFGVNEWWPRLVVPLCAMASVPLLHRLEALLWPAQRPRHAAVWVLFGSLLFAVLLTPTMFDMPLMLCVMVAMVGLLRAARGELLPGFALVALGLGLGALVKGPVILVHVLPAALSAPWWMPGKPSSWRRWYGCLGLAIAGGIAIPLLWAVPAAIHGGPDYARAILWSQTTGRMAGSFAHRQPWWWYFPLLPIVLFPWFTWPALWQGLSRRLAERSCAPGARFLVAWLVPTLIAFSFISGKQAKYLVPLLPAFALLAGYALSAPGAVVTRRGMLMPALGFFLCGAVVAALRFLPGDLGLPEWTGAIPLWPAGVLMGIAIVLLASPALPALARVRALGIAMLVSATAVSVGIVPVIGPFYDVTRIARMVAEFQHKGTPVAYLGKYHAQFNFLGRLRDPLHVVDERELDRWLSKHPGGVVVETELDRHQPGPGGPEFAQPFRGGQMTLWKGTNLLAFHLDERRRFTPGSGDQGAR